MVRFKRIMLKLSGESLMGKQDFGIDPEMTNLYAREIKSAVDAGIQVAIVIGGGNIYRGMDAEEAGIERAQGDYMGMLATVMNGMALQSVLEKYGIKDSQKVLAELLAARKGNTVVKESLKIKNIKK